MNRLLEMRSRPLICAITDRTILRTANQPGALTDYIHRLAAAGVDIVQIRERDLSAREAFHLSHRARECARPYNIVVLVNDRPDVAACAGIGVHLTTRSLAAQVVRRTFGPDLIIGVSTHNLDEALEAEKGGADFIVFGPVFDTASKRAYGTPVGLGALERVLSQVNLPVLGIGGVTAANFRSVISSGAAGIAGISMFVEAPDLSRLVREVKHVEDD